MKNNSFWFFTFILVTIILSCGGPTQTKRDYISIQGRTMGTSYHLKCEANIVSREELQNDIDSLLKAFNLEVSTYIDASVISVFNRAEDTFTFNKQLNPHFYDNLHHSYHFYEITEGFFDPTVMPLVNYWGFGYEPRDSQHRADSFIVDSLVKSVGLEKLKMEERGDTIVLIKTVPGMKLDFSAIAKGDGVDEVANYLTGKGVEHFLMDIGGELFSKGQNPDGENWIIGINQPAEDAKITDIIKKVNVSGRGLATSGNYRNFYRVGENVFSHTINPKTGYTERNQMLSASIISATCMRSDALATACMTMGEDRVKEMAPDWENTAVFIVYQQDGEVKTWSTDEFKNYIKD